MITFILAGIDTQRLFDLCANGTGPVRRSVDMTMQRQGEHTFPGPLLNKSSYAEAAHRQSVIQKI